MFAGDHVPSSELQIIKEEKPPPSAGLSSKPSKKKTNSKLLVEARNKEQLTEPSSEKVSTSSWLWCVV